MRNDIKLREIEAYYFKNELNQCRQLIEKLQETEKNDGVKEILGKINFLEKNYPESERLLLCLLIKNKLSAEGYYFLSKIKIIESEFNKAIEYLKKAIKISGGFYEGLIDLGNINYELGKKKEAVKYFKEALKFNPIGFEVNFNIGNILKEQEKYKEASEHFKICKRIDPNRVEVYIKIAEIYNKQNFINNAIDELHITKKLKINNLEIAYLLTFLLIRARRYDEAIEICNDELKSDPNNRNLHYNKNLAFNEKKLYVEALECIDKVSKIILLDNEFLNLKSIIQIKLKKYNDALKTLSFINKNETHDEHVYINKSAALIGLLKYEEATYEVNCALTINAKNRSALYNKGKLLHKLNYIDDAEIIFKKLINQDKNDYEAKYELSTIYLNDNKFELGWDLYKSRWFIEECESKKILTKRPTWSGKEKFNTLYVYSEQGIGDQILHSSILSHLSEHSGSKVIRIDGRLINIYKRSFSNFDFIDNKATLDENTYDYQIPIGDLGGVYRNNLIAFTKKDPLFLITNSILDTEIKSSINFPIDKKLCGISWKSQSKHISKSLELMDLVPILKNRNINFINLQYGNVDFEIALVEEKIKSKIFKMQDLDIFNEIDRLLSLINACDFIITSSNVTAHLAGAIGKKTFLITRNKNERFWYWNHLDGVSIWYPSVKVIENEDFEDWSDSINRMDSILQNMYS